MFEQNVKDFFKSKTNWTGLTMVISAIVGFRTQALDPVAAVNMAFGGLALICIKDAIAK